MWVSQHDTNAFLSYASDGKWKMFFKCIFLYGTLNEKVAERKKGNEVKAGKWKHVPLCEIYWAGVTDRLIRHTYYRRICS